MPTFIELEGLLGTHISGICPRGYASNADNHCAHFVSHVLGYRFNTTCGTMSRTPGTEASIRVHEVFARCSSAGTWATRPVTMFWGLVFITRASNVNVNARTMVNVPRKHIGIFLGVVPSIWHYSNSQRKVVRQTPEQFSNHYPSPDNAMFWGVPP